MNSYSLRACESISRRCFSEQGDLNLREVAVFRGVVLPLLFLCLLAVLPFVAVAEEGPRVSSSTTVPNKTTQAGKRKGPRGMITSSSCPLSCADFSLPEGFCRAWRAGNVCYVEDFTQPPGHRSMIRLPPSSQNGRGRTSSLGSSSVQGRSARARMANGAADKRRGFVTSTSCPYTCGDAKIPEEHCRERRVGNRCEVEDLRLGAGHQSMIRIPLSAYRIPGRGGNTTTSTSPATLGAGKKGANSKSSYASSTLANRRGMITSARCPYSCKSAGVPSGFCKEWSSGEKCFVEDLTQAPGHRSMIRLPH
jgi:hypothetical protein